MPFDFKKEYRDLYQPKTRPSIVEVPPLEGFWWQPGVRGVDRADKSSFRWVSVIRVPEFVLDADFAWAVEAATAKKRLDFSPVQLVEVDEGLCVQCMRVGPYGDEPATVEAMHEFAESQGYAPDITDARRHHEIYLSDPRKADPAKMKTVVRHPIRPLESPLQSPCPKQIDSLRAR